MPPGRRCGALTAQTVTLAAVLEEETLGVVDLQAQVTEPLAGDGWLAAPDTAVGGDVAVVLGESWHGGGSVSFRATEVTGHW